MKELAKFCFVPVRDYLNLYVYKSIDIFVIIFYSACEFIGNLYLHFVEQLPLMSVTDRHWIASVGKKPTVPASHLKSLRDSEYTSSYVEMKDGVSIAVDVNLPPKLSDEETFPCAFFQTRYCRGMKLRWPFNRLTNKKPIDLINFELKASLLDRGFAVVTIDVRGTGASFGKWRYPWTPESQDDSVEILDWICRQPWSNGKVCLAGTSYEASAALFTLAKQHPSVKAIACSYCFWDLYGDIALPGGIPQRSFTEEWGAFCAAMDSNNLMLLPPHSRYLISALVKGLRARV
eukprot:jgi/Botrbrau1/7275/Bobra.0318s0013.1